MSQLLALIRHCWTTQRPAASKRPSYRPTIECLDPRVLPSGVPDAGSLVITLTDPQPAPPPEVVLPVQYVEDPLP